MIKRTEECGCRINQAYDEKPFIAYCPLHKAAKVLYMACYAASVEIEDGSPHKARLILKKATNEAEVSNE